MPLIITQQPRRHGPVVYPAARGYDEYRRDGTDGSDPRNFQQMEAMRDMDGRSLAEAEMSDTKLRGCEDLDDVIRLFIRQRMPVDLKAGCGGSNTYNIQDENGRTLFRAEEERNCFCRWCCGPHRAYHITVYNQKNEAILHFDRACCRCDWCCCFDCCLCQHVVEIRDWKGDVIGKARQRFHVFHLKLDVSEFEQQPFCRIRGPCCPCRCCIEMNFDIVTVKMNKPVGYIAKTFPGYREYFNVDHENFEIYCPHGLSTAQKAILLGAAFLVNFMYFEMS